MGLKTLRKCIPAHEETLSSAYENELKQGLMNGKIILPNHKAIWPLWVGNQLNVNSPTATPSGIPLFLNHTQRNWTALSSPGIREMAIVDPQGLITPLEKGWSLEAWIANSSKVISPSQLKSINQTFDPVTKTVTTKYSINEVEIEQSCFFSTTSNSQQALFNQIRITNTSSSALKLSILLAIRPYNPEGFSPIYDCQYLTSNAMIINRKLGLVLDQKPSNVVCLNHEDGDVSNCYGKWEMILSRHCTKGMGSAYIDYHLSIPATKSTTISCKLPTDSKGQLIQVGTKLLPQLQKKQLEDHLALLHKKPYESEHQKMVQKQSIPNSTLTEIQLPDTKLTTLIKQSIVHLQHFKSHKTIRSQSFDTQKLSLKDFYFILKGFLAMNATDDSKELLNSLHKMLHLKYSSLSINDLSFALLSIYDYFQSTHHYTCLETYHKLILKTSKKLIQKCQSFYHFEEKLWYSIFRPNLDLDDCSIDHPLITQLFWALSALSKSHHLLSAIKDKKNAQLIERSAQQLNFFTSRIIETMSEKASISKLQFNDLNPHFIPSLIGIYPLDTLEKFPTFKTKLLNNLSSHINDNNVYFHPYGHTGYSVSYNCNLGLAYLKTNKKTCLPILEWIKTAASNTGTWPEIINIQTMQGCNGDGHHVLSHAWFLTFIQQLLACESGSDLILTKELPLQYFDPAKTIQVTQLNTYFGPITFTLICFDTTIECHYSHQFHTKPSHLKLTLPFKILSIQDNYGARDINEKNVDLPLHSSKVTLSIER